MPANSNAFREPGASIPAYNKTPISGAVADTTIKASRGIARSVMINTAGAALSTISVYDGATSGTAFAVIDATQVGKFFQFDADCPTSIHVKTIDSGGTLQISVMWM